MRHFLAYSEKIRYLCTASESTFPAKGNRNIPGWHINQQIQDMTERIDQYKPDVVVLGGGDYPTHALPLTLLHEAERIVCCDGAMFSLLRHGMEPWRIVGDCDTIFTTEDPEEQQMVEEHLDRIRRYEEQDDNDQTKAVRYCLSHGMRRIAIVGATGRREDHTLGNISLCIEYMRMGADVRIYTDHGVFLPCQDRIELEVPIPEQFEAVSDAIATRQKSVQISIFNVSAHGFRSEGLRYPLYDFSNWWQGTLNEAIASEVTIEAEGEFMVYVCYE